MTLTASVFIATSLDGYISRADGAIDWLEAANAVVPPGEDCGYAAFMDTVDVLVMGRNTFELVLGFPEWPYGDKRLIVLTSRPLALPATLPSTVSVSNETPAALTARLAGEGVRRIYVDGGITIQRFLAAGLIADLTVTTIPVLLGSGRRLFGALDADVALELVASRAYPFGFVQSTYRVRRA
ncbi:deaminase [Azoarcus sp. DD4]|uniref:dihydrofolate reductase family protein n=1 Tax=Azoarcus sp. DD4 TaxID=2027405 RepID=UPI00112A7C3E|nr:dihydrofolate reductase family protein [Azoarcus sp. DD4]QDF98414.1 deaminase [Azoarcus sp. DD4]